jgi:SPP1 family predicted phage head-tail adaptor
MNPGELDQRVTLQTATLSRDAVGGPVETWVDTVTVWAKVKPLSGKQIAQAQQVSADVSKAVTIRYRTGITAAMRVKFSDATTAKIHWVEEYRREGRLVIVCEDFNG